MFGTQHLGLFISAGLLLNMTPGPDTMYILGRTLAQGRSAGIASVLGISTGCLVHTLAAGLGLSAILVGSALAFSCVKFVGLVVSKKQQPDLISGVHFETAPMKYT